MHSGRTVTIVSPELYLTETMYVKLAEASMRGVRINILCGTVPDPAVAHLLSILKNLTLACSENMNARCYYNEEQMLITSMGLCDIENAHGINTGILISSSTDHELFSSIDRDITDAFEHGIKIVIEQGTGEQRPDPEGTYRGFCIGCGLPVSFNPAKPFCRMCNTTYGQAQADMGGEFCHSCGNKFHVTVENPLCRTCKTV